MGVRQRDAWPMKIPNIITNRKAREDLKEKFEVVMAVAVITGFLYKRYKKSQDPYIDITSLDKEKS